VAARGKHARALPQVKWCIRDMFDHRVRQHEIKGAAGERKRHAVGECEVQIA
jgi:hypothetical protein